jgi:lipopolysaccharide transport system ATP-binding protein
MSGDVVIRAEGLGKKYVIGHELEGQRYTALRDVIGRTAKNLLRTTSDMLRGRAMVAGDITEEFWALKDINFEIERGEIVGIIGRNGAGKSTLLKILSRITEPTKGRVEIRGRTASLLEVGTGFHPELTGRENIYLNGAILGMGRAEIRRKFDAIVAFAEVETFLDTPVKRYSSGMYVRLAFAVAAHLEPEILIVDEVLAVGDIEFQKKCLGKMSEVASGGRTVLFVSHNLDAIRRACEIGILLSDGRVVMKSEIGQCIDKYRGFLDRSATQGRVRFPAGIRDQHHIIDIAILDDQLQPIVRPTTWKPVVFAIRFHSPSYIANASVTFQISTMEGFLVTFCATKPDQAFPISFNAGENLIYLNFESLSLSAGSYVVGAGLAIPNHQWLYNEPNGAIIEVASQDVYSAGMSPRLERYPVPMRCRWEKSQQMEGSTCACPDLDKAR